VVANSFAYLFHADWMTSYKPLILGSNLAWFAIVFTGAYLIEKTKVASGGRTNPWFQACT
jgi:hypothetical protein